MITPQKEELLENPAYDHFLKFVKERLITDSTDQTVRDEFAKIEAELERLRKLAQSQSQPQKAQEQIGAFARMFYRLFDLIGVHLLPAANSDTRAAYKKEETRVDGGLAWS